LQHRLNIHFLFLLRI